MIKIAIAGRFGRMGVETAASVESDAKTQLAGGLSRKPSAAKTNEVIVSSFSQWTKDYPDVLIDFSSPEVLSEALNWCVKNQIPYVGGTTGLIDSQFDEIAKAAKSIPILWASNMSLGVAILNEMIPILAKLDGAEIQLEETHHKFKKDKPSGTAIDLQKTIKKFGQNHTVGDPISIRGGGVFGDHKISALAQDEVLCIEHRALNRKVFANGSVHAAKWIIGQSKGRYSMKDALGLA